MTESDNGSDGSCAKILSTVVKIDEKLSRPKWKSVLWDAGKLAVIAVLNFLLGWIIVTHQISAQDRLAQKEISAQDRLAQKDRDHAKEMEELKHNHEQDLIRYAQLAPKRVEANANTARLQEQVIRQLKEYIRLDAPAVSPEAVSILKRLDDHIVSNKTHFTPLLLSRLEEFREAASKLYFDVQGQKLAPPEIEKKMNALERRKNECFEMMRNEVE